MIAVKKCRQKALITSESINSDLKQHTLLILVMFISVHLSILQELEDSGKSDCWLFNVEHMQGWNSPLSSFSLECAMKVLSLNIKLLSQFDKNNLTTKNDNPCRNKIS